MGMIQEFKAFAMRGNVMDMAVGIIIGGAFGKIVSSFVGDVIMPFVGLITGGVDFKDQKTVLKAAETNEAGEVTSEALVFNYGQFLTTVIDFVIIAFAIFMMVKIMNKAQESFADKPEEEKPAPPEDIQLLREIRDTLKAQS